VSFCKDNFISVFSKNFLCILYVPLNSKNHKKEEFMEYNIVHQPGQQLFKTEVEGRTAFVQYRLIEGSLDIIHTQVPIPLEGRGIAGALVKAAYDYALDNGLKLKATCSYAVKWLERHPELSDKTV